MTQGTQSHCSVKTWRDGVGREVGSGGRGHMYAYGRFMLMYGKKKSQYGKQKKTKEIPLHLTMNHGAILLNSIM